MPDDCPALVLNADFRPLSYYPLSLWSWQEAVKAVFLSRVNVIAEYDRTFDHIIPRSRGGRTTWENVVAACAPCNLAKGNRSLNDAGMSLIQPAYRPTTHHLREAGRAFPPNHLHESWRDFLYWDAELES